MFAYVLLLIGVLTRVLPHAGWWNFSAEGASLLYFGARRPWREMIAPLAAFMATDYLLTVFAYHDAFHVEGYLVQWGWYLGVMVLGYVLLRRRTTVARVGAGAVLGPTAFFVLTNFAAWAGSGMYPHTVAGLETCYALAIPFYRNDVVSTAIVAGLAFGVPVLMRRLDAAHARPALEGK